MVTTTGTHRSAFSCMRMWRRISSSARIMAPLSASNAATRCCLTARRLLCAARSASSLCAASSIRFLQRAGEERMSGGEEAAAQTAGPGCPPRIGRLQRPLLLLQRPQGGQLLAAPLQLLLSLLLLLQVEGHPLLLLQLRAGLGLTPCLALPPLLRPPRNLHQARVVD